MGGQTTIDSLKIEETFEFVERGIWMSIGSFCDLEFAPYGISVSNGQEEQNLLHFEDFQEAVSLKLAYATDFNDNSTFETKMTYHNSLVSGHLFNSSIEYVRKDYSVLDFQDFSFSTKIKYLKSINSLLSLKLGIQEFNNQSSFGGAIGLEKKHYLTRIQYGGLIGYWNDYLTYNLYFRAFIYKRTVSFIGKYDRINDTDFFKIGIHYLFKTKEDKY